MNNQDLIGKKVRGFKFETEISRFHYYDNRMDDYIGKIGVIDNIDSEDNGVKVKFENNLWTYPLDQIQAHLVEETEEEKKYGPIKGKLLSNETQIQDINKMFEIDLNTKIEQLAKELFVKEYNFNQDAERISQDSIEAAKEFYNQLNQN